MSRINWGISKTDHAVIMEIVERVFREDPKYPDDQRTLIMDLTACHLNGCPLDLTALLGAEGSDLFHDVYGIRRHIDRSTGKLKYCFDPRYSKPAKAQLA